MPTLYRTVLCGTCGERSVIANAAGIKADGNPRNPLPYEDSFVMTCPCGHRDVYGVQVVENVLYPEELSAVEFARNVARFRPLPMAAEADPDNPEWTAEMSARALRFHQLPASLQGKLKR